MLGVLVVVFKKYVRRAANYPAERVNLQGYIKPYSLPCYPLAPKDIQLLHR